MHASVTLSNDYFSCIGCLNQFLKIILYCKHAVRIRASKIGALLDQQVIKSIGACGRISLGKEYAGRQVLVEMSESVV